MSGVARVRIELVAPGEGHSAEPLRTYLGRLAGVRKVEVDELRGRVLVVVDPAARFPLREVPRCVTASGEVLGTMSIELDRSSAAEWFLVEFEGDEVHLQHADHR